MQHVRPRRLTAVFAVAAAALVVAVATAAAHSDGGAKRGAGATVSVLSTDVGRILVDSRGWTLYLYTPDKTSTSTCYGQCASFWPPLLTAGAPHAGRGARASLLGTTKRKDGKLQVTYAGHPLYFFKEDTAPGDAHGQGLEKIWYALSASGARVTTAPPAATIALAKTGLGSVLVDSRGMTLYMFTPDSGTTSACYGQCAVIWPPLLLTSKLRAAAGLETPLLGMIQRTDGSWQVTYNGHPLYFFAKDTKPGDTNGQGIVGKWWVLSGTGAPIGGP